MLGSAYVDLTWSAATDNVRVSGYRVYRNGVLISTTNSLSFRDKHVSKYKIYKYHLIAFDAAGNISASNIVTITT